MSRKELIRSLKFLLFSISAGVIELVSFSLLNELTAWSYWPCYLIALVLSVLWNFTLNRRYTFQSAGNVPRAMALVALFYCVFTPASTVLGSYLADTLLWNEYLVTILNMVLNFVLEYLYDRFVVFRGTLDTNRLAQKRAGGVRTRRSGAGSRETGGPVPGGPCYLDRADRTERKRAGPVGPARSACGKTPLAGGFGGRKSVKGNRQGSLLRAI